MLHNFGVQVSTQNPCSLQLWDAGKHEKDCSLTQQTSPRPFLFKARPWIKDEVVQGCISLIYGKLQEDCGSVRGQEQANRSGSPLLSARCQYGCSCLCQHGCTLVHMMSRHHQGANCMQHARCCGALMAGCDL